MEVNMIKKKHLILVISAILSFTCLSFAQFQGDKIYNKIKVKSGIGFEYFNRAVSLNDDEASSSLSSYLFTLNAEFETQGGFFLNVMAGFSLSEFDSITYRELPFSIELESGKIGGYLLGGKIKKSIITLNDFEIGGTAEFVYYIGKEKEWEISDLSVPGTVTGKPSWMRALAGAVITYKGYDYFYPYVSIGYNKLWGTFTLEETIQNLKGTEEKKISGKSNISTVVGTVYELTNALSINAEIKLFPYKDGVDFGLLFKAMYSF